MTRTHFCEELSEGLVVHTRLFFLPSSLPTIKTIWKATRTGVIKSDIHKPQFPEKTFFFCWKINLIYKGTAIFFNADVRDFHS